MELVCTPTTCTY